MIRRIFMKRKKLYDDETIILKSNSIDKIIIEDREYSEEEILKILKKYKKEEDKKYHKCYRCGNRYLENNRFNMVVNNLEQRICNIYANGYATTPYITGFKILAKCGQGKEIGLCDDCISELIKWLTKKEE
jgi:hypothetical protein